MKRNGRLLSTGFAALCAAVAFTAAASAQDQTVVVAATGGAYEQSLRAAFFEPFTKATGIKVQVVAASAQEQITKLRAMNESKSVAWDVAVLGDIEAHADHVRKMTEDMTEFCKPFGNRKDLTEGACDASGVKLNSGLTYIVYNGDVLPNGGPKNWKEVWDVKRFPGGRSFPNFNDPWRVMAAALVADGVEPKNLFPLDIDRALKKLDELKPHITLWWKTGDASTQGYRNKEFVVGMIWQTRTTPLIREGINIKFSLEEAVLVADRATLVKGAPNKENAVKLLEFIQKSVEGMAKHCETLGCTPPSTEAMARMSPERQAAMPVKKEIYDRLIVPDYDWINANRPKMLDRWNQWIQS